MWQEDSLMNHIVAEKKLRRWSVLYWKNLKLYHIFDARVEINIWIYKLLISYVYVCFVLLYIGTIYIYAIYVYICNSGKQKLSST